MPAKKKEASPPGLWFRVVGNHTVQGVVPGGSVLLTDAGHAQTLAAAGHVRLLSARDGKPVSLADQTAVIYEEI